MKLNGTDQVIEQIETNEHTGRRDKVVLITMPPK